VKLKSIKTRAKVRCYRTWFNTGHDAFKNINLCLIGKHSQRNNLKNQQKKNIKCKLNMTLHIYTIGINSFKSCTNIRAYTTTET